MTLYPGIRNRPKALSARRKWPRSIPCSSSPVAGSGPCTIPSIVKLIPGDGSILTFQVGAIAAGSLGWKEISCRVASRSEVGDFEGLLLNLHDNLTVRALNEIEKGMVLSRLAVHLGTEEILSRFMPLLGLASHHPLYRFYMEMEEGLTQEEKGYVANGTVSFAALKAAMTVEPTSRLALLRMLHNLILNIRRQLCVV